MPSFRHLARALPAILFLAPLAGGEAGLDALQDAGRWKELRPKVEAWYRQKPEDPYAMIWMSKVKAAFGDTRGALDLARKAAALKPADALVQAQLGAAAGQAAGEADGMMAQFSLAREMKKALEIALAGNPGDSDSAQYLIQYYLMAPGIAGGSVAKAKEVAQHLGQVKPLDGLLRRSEIALHEKDLEGAKALVQQALARDGASYEANLAMANVWLAQKPQALDPALACCRKALEAKPTGVLAHAEIAGILADQGKWAELDAALAQARKAVPSNLWPAYAAGKEILVDNKGPERAEPLFRAYLGQEPEGGAPDLAAAHWRLGQVYDKLGRKEEAIREFEAALRLKPGFKAAAKDLERLRKG
jgi:tetratricopeptide (TPR) repeat protein